MGCQPPSSRSSPSGPGRCTFDSCSRRCTHTNNLGYNTHSIATSRPSGNSHSMSSTTGSHTSNYSAGMRVGNTCSLKRRLLSRARHLQDQELLCPACAGTVGDPCVRRDYRPVCRATLFHLPSRYSRLHCHRNYQERCHDHQCDSMLQLQDVLLPTHAIEHLWCGCCSSHQ